MNILFVPHKTKSQYKYSALKSLVDADPNHEIFHDFSHDCPTITDFYRDSNSFSFTEYLTYPSSDSIIVVKKPKSILASNDISGQFVKTAIHSIFRIDLLWNLHLYIRNPKPGMHNDYYNNEIHHNEIYDKYPISVQRYETKDAIYVIINNCQVREIIDTMRKFGRRILYGLHLQCAHELGRGLGLGFGLGQDPRYYVELTEETSVFGDKFIVPNFIPSSAIVSYKFKSDIRSAIFRLAGFQDRDVVANLNNLYRTSKLFEKCETRTYHTGIGLRSNNIEVTTYTLRIRKNFFKDIKCVVMTVNMSCIQTMYMIVGHLRHLEHILQLSLLSSAASNASATLDASTASITLPAELLQSP